MLVVDVQTQRNRGLPGRGSAGCPGRALPTAQAHGAHTYMHTHMHKQAPSEKQEQGKAKGGRG